MLKISIYISDNKNLLIVLKDDGIGFAENGKGDGNGLRNMQKRMSLLAQSEITNANGVEVKIAVPLFQQQRV